MKKDSAVYLKDMVESMEKISHFIRERSYEDFETDEMLYDAVMRRLEIIGEAASRINDEVKARNSDIPWKSMIGLRNILIHQYGEADVKQLWTIVTIDLPVTLDILKQIIS